MSVSPSKGNQVTTRGKEKIFDLGGNRTHESNSSGLILCFAIGVLSATRHNIHMYPYFLFAAIHHLNRPRLSLSDLVAQSVE